MAPVRRIILLKSTQEGSMDEEFEVVGLICRRRVMTTGGGQVAVQTNSAVGGDALSGHGKRRRNNDDDDDDDDDEDDDSPSVKEILFKTKRNGVLSSKRKTAEPTQNKSSEDRSDSTTPSSDPGQSRKRRCIRASGSAVMRVKRPVIDLTDDTEHCGICPNVLGQGDGDAARTFSFETCGCVRAWNVLVATNAKLTNELEAQKQINDGLQEQLHNLSSASQRSYFSRVPTVELTQYNKLNQEYGKVQRELDDAKRREES